ncbi:Lrp/AsnC family transcriptional regulator [Saccharopolyspora sp. K220]|uniref:Lrp/AsnC family transcriptional regulator n=1 Tax=Saccharopolyspora soli TaxID=2926618 RepID=UPI001F5AC28E|nr:Lrp/AsnC family transcriptional regulator [Saccharopolyspora soli]MCI2416956.1 Lrp/AsnC family transcriptional regulator [Saccharopolyspora soli]
MDEDGAGIPGRGLPGPARRESRKLTGLDTVDDLSRRIVVALQQDGRASWTAIAAACGTSVPTVARRVQQLVADGVVRVAVMPRLGSTGPVETFFVRIGCRPGTQLEVAAQLVARDDVRWAALITGPYDIAVELVVDAGPTRYPKTMLELQTIPGVERWYSDLLLHVYKVSHDWSRQLLGDETGGGSQVAEPTLCEPSHLDQIDWAILAVLRENGRASFKSVADVLELNESTVRRRFERMTGDGCATVVTIVPAAALGLEAETVLTVSVEPAKLNEVADAMRRHRSVRYLAATLDGNSLLCEVIATSTKGLFEFTTSTLANLPGVVGWSASVELLSLKRGFVETPWWRDQLAEHLADDVAFEGFGVGSAGAEVGPRGQRGW